MAYVERTDDEIVEAWEKWLKDLTEPNQLALLIGTRNFSAIEFVQALVNRDPQVVFIIEGCRALARHRDCDPVEDIVNQRY